MKKQLVSKGKQPKAAPRKDGDATKQAILDAAEVVFASHGYEGAPMKAVAKTAKVTQGLIHYHFETKERLFEEVLRRRSTAINAFRQGFVDKLFADGATPALEELLEAFYAPTAYTYGGSKETMVPYSQLAATVTIAPDERSKILTERFFDGIALIFIDAFQKCVPGLTLADAVFAYMFALGARAHVHSHNDRAARLSKGACSNADLRKVVDRVIPFVAAGIRQLASDGANKSSPNTDPKSSLARQQ
ncbi:AcrR family transcriptional regulator [Bradyrhizobium sp. USDA 4341]